MKWQLSQNCFQNFAALSQIVNWSSLRLVLVERPLAQSPGELRCTETRNCHLKINLWRQTSSSSNSSISARTSAKKWCIVFCKLAKTNSTMTSGLSLNALRIPAAEASQLTSKARSFHSLRRFQQRESLKTKPNPFHTLRAIWILCREPRAETWEQ